MVIAFLDGPQADDGTAWEIGYFYAQKSPEQKIIGIRTEFRRAVANFTSDCWFSFRQYQWGFVPSLQRAVSRTNCGAFLLGSHHFNGFITEAG